MITELDKFLRRFGLRVWRPQEGAEVIRHIERTTPVYNIRTGLYALNILLDQSVANLYDIVIFDRCIFDAYSWMMYWEEKGKLSEEETRIFQQFFISGFWRDYLDAVFIVVCEPEKAMERELRISLTKKTGATSNPKTIRGLVDRYKRAYTELSPSCPQLHLLDTTNFGEQEMIEKITGQVLNILEKKAKSL
jgi:thymidylate kinase